MVARPMPFVLSSFLNIFLLLPLTQIGYEVLERGRHDFKSPHGQSEGW